MPAETYGILLVSFSKHSHQQHFIPLYQAHPRLRIIGVADYPDIDPDLRAYNQHWASQLGVPYSEDLDESIDDPAIDIVSVGCEIERRSALIVRAAEAGKHLWIDKFPGATLAESEAVRSRSNAPMSGRSSPATPTAPSPSTPAKSSPAATWAPCSASTSM